MKLMDRDRMMRDNGRRGYESNRGDRYYEERYIEDKYKNERMRRPESPKHRSRRGVIIYNFYLVKVDYEKKIKF